MYHHMYLDFAGDPNTQAALSCVPDMDLATHKCRDSPEGVRGELSATPASMARLCSQEQGGLSWRYGMSVHVCHGVRH